MQEVQVGERIVKVFKDGFVKLEDISTNAATPSSVAFANLKNNINLGLPKIEDLPEYRQIKGHDNKIAVVGGGPSLKKCINELKDFDVIIACGSVHDYLVEQGFTPTYATICDPDPISINYFKRLNLKTKYLISTGVDPSVIHHFKGFDTVLWHCHSQDYDATEIEKLEGRTYHAISGGCTVGLRSINIALMLGYTNVHIFGFDSCMSEEECHAYAVSEQERINFGRLYSIKLKSLDNKEGPADKQYYCLGYQLAQAHNFKEFYLNFGRLFTPTFHGEGLLPDFFKLIIFMLNGEIPRSGEVVQ